MKTLGLLLAIVFLGLVLRVYNLASIPPSLDWDEASLGWNAYSLLTTGTDEYGVAHPVSIRSFNDYKPPLYVYSLIPVQAVLGLTEFSTRLPSALAGTLTILVMFFLAKFLTNSKKVGLTTALLFAITPWTIQFSRGAFEANLALFWFSAGTLGLVYYLKHPKWLSLLLSLLAFSLSIYAYHSTRLVIPVFLLLVGLGNFKLFWSKKKTVLIVGVIFLLTLLPLLRNSLRVGGPQARFSAVSIFNKLPSPDTNTIIDRLNANPLVYYPQVIATNYLAHFNFNFLFLEADNNGRHHAPDSGLLLFVEGFGLLAAILLLVRKKPTWLWVVVSLAVASPAASAISEGAPHAIRSLTLVVPLVFLAGFGIAKAKFKFANVGWPLLTIISLFFFAHQYFIHFGTEYAKDWQYGYKQLVQKVLAVEKDYDHVSVTAAYDQPYIYFLYYGRISPVVKNDGFFYKTLDKYSFGDLGKDFCCKVLIASAPDEPVSGATLIDKLYFPDGTLAFNIWSKINHK